MLQIDGVMRKLCEAGAQSVRRYVDVAGDDPWTMPEYFMRAFFLDRSGNEITMTLETGFGTLVEWNTGVRIRRSMPERAHDDRLLRLAEQLGGRRVDLAIFAGEEEHKAKDQQDLFALVEYKRGWISANRDPGGMSDRDKLLMLLAHVDTCPCGIVCGWAIEDHARWQRDVSIKSTSDHWCEQKIELPEGYTSSLLFCARAFERLSDDPRIDELLSAMPPGALGAQIIGAMETG
jgi:hypothetical protein